MSPYLITYLIGAVIGLGLMVASAVTVPPRQQTSPRTWAGLILLWPLWMVLLPILLLLDHDSEIEDRA